MAWAFHTPSFPSVCLGGNLPTPPGVDKNAFSVSGNVFFRHSLTSVYIILGELGKTHTRKLMGHSFLYNTHRLCGPELFRITGPPIEPQRKTGHFTGPRRKRGIRFPCSVIGQLRPLPASFSMDIRAGPFRIVDP